MTDRHLTTHGPGCWGWGPKHYECAVRRAEQLERDLAEYAVRRAEQLDRDLAEYEQAMREQYEQAMREQEEGREQ